MTRRRPAAGARRVERVLHLTQSSAPGGIQRLLRELVPHQVSTGLTVGVACPPTTGLDPVVRGAGATSYEWRASRGLGPVALLKEGLQLRRILRDFRPDIVHLHSSKAGLIGRLLYRGPAIFQPQAWSFHHVPRSIRPMVVGWERLGGRLVSRTVCSSYDELEEGRAHRVVGEAPVVENGIELDDFPMLDDDDRQIGRKHLGIERDTPVALCIGRFCRQKGQDRLLDAWPHVLRQLPDARLLLVGGGPDEDMLRRKGVDNISWYPWQLDVHPFIAAADVIVMPSRWEGMSFGLIEALASGRSIVATSATAMRENIEPFGAGAIVDLEGEVTGGLAEAIAARLLDRNLRNDEGRNGRLRAEQLTIARMAERLREIYDDVVRAADR